MAIQVKHAQGQEATATSGQAHTDITGTRGGNNTAGQHTDQVPLQTKVDDASAAVMYEGRTHRLGAEDTDLVWQITRTTVIGDITTTEYALDDSGFNYAWSARASLFNGDGFFNSRSLEFNGVDERLSAGDVYLYDAATAWSLSAWVKANNFSAIRSIYDKRTPDTNAYGVALLIDTSANLRWQMRVAGGLRQHIGSIVLSSLTWHHLAVTYAGGSNIDGATIYVDGVADTSPSSGTLPATLLHNQDALFGARRTATVPTSHFSGNMDEMAFFGKELSASEVGDVYNSGMPTDLTEELFSGDIDNYYRLETDTDPTIIDQVGSDNLAMENMADTNFDSDVP